MVKIINDKTDKQKLLKIYVPIIEDHFKNIQLSYNEIGKHLRLMFNTDATIEDIQLYFEPTIEEDILDLELLTKNLGYSYV